MKKNLKRENKLFSHNKQGLATIFKNKILPKLQPLKH